MSPTTGDSGWAISAARGTPPYLRPWRGDAAEPGRRNSAATLIRLAFKSPKVSDAHRTRLVKDLLWDLTEADGKYSTRYRSEGTRQLGRRADWNSVLQHEHVEPRKALRAMIDELPEQRVDELERVLARVIACVVTRDEHRRLSAVPGSVTGWDRYRLAEVAVWDLGADPPALLPEAAPLPKP